MTNEPMAADDEYYDDELFGSSAMDRYPVRWCIDVRVSPRYL